MKNKNFKKILLIFIACILSVAGVFCGIFLPESELNNTIEKIENEVIEEIKTEIIVSEETIETVNETIEATEKGEDLSTTEIIESSEEEELNVTDEGITEIDAVVEQENISYNGGNTGNGLSLLGNYQGLTYYSQADSRWANIMYSSIGDRLQTMKSSACGPTSAAIIVSSSKGTILPTTMANLFVDNGYRTANNGTAWAAFPFVADYFDFNEYYTTSNFDKAMSYLTQKDSNGNSKYYMVASCGSGLFTNGGHYIVLVSLDGDTIQVYDPYLYSGKFTTASRKAAGATVSGNSVFVSKSSFKKYANYRNFWIFSNDNGSGNTASNNTSSVNYIKYVATQSANLNVRSGAGTNYSTITSLAKGTKVNVIEVQGDWNKINSPVSGWVNSSYLSSSIVNNTSSNYNVKVTAKSGLNIRAGASTGYRILGCYKYGTTVTITKTNGNWGKTNKGWICLTYTSNTNTYTSTTTKISSVYSLGLYQVNTRSGLNVRAGAGTNYKMKKVYSNGTRFDTYEIKGDWARTPSGWVNLKYCKLIRKY